MLVLAQETTPPRPVEQENVADAALLLSEVDDMVPTPTLPRQVTNPPRPVEQEDVASPTLLLSEVDAVVPMWTLQNM